MSSSERPGDCSRAFLNSVSETLPLPSASAWVWLRIRSDNTAFDAELQGLIDAAKQDLRRRGIKAADNDPLIKQAVKMYCKANFGYGGSDADKFQKSYESLAVSLSLSGEYLED